MAIEKQGIGEKKEATRLTSEQEEKKRRRGGAVFSCDYETRTKNFLLSFLSFPL